MRESTTRFKAGSGKGESLMNERQNIKVDLLALWQECEGYYQCPHGVGGLRLGPLVGYAGHYSDINGKRKSYVGEEYYNFVKIEEDIYYLDLFAAAIAERIDVPDRITAVIGAPMGGILLAGALSRMINCKVKFAEKKVVALATKTRREKTILTLKRHQIEAGDNVIIAEDVCNNFSATAEMIALVEKQKGHVAMVACALNRSAEKTYSSTRETIPVISAIHAPLNQYRQDDPFVEASVRMGYVVWKPKDEWERLQGL